MIINVYVPQIAQNRAAAQLSSNTLRHTRKGLRTPQWMFLYFHVGTDEQQTLVQR